MQTTAAAPAPPPVDITALTAATLRVGRVHPRERWYGGPVALRREHKGYVVDLADYLTWLAELERATDWDVDEFVQRVRLLYYGKATGNALFDTVLDTTGSDWAGAPVTVKDVPQQTLDNLFRTGAIRVRRDLPPVDLSHLWVLADRARNGLSYKAHAVDTGLADVTGLLSWTGDLASWWSQWNDTRTTVRRDAVARRVPVTEPPFTESADPAVIAAVPAKWLDAAVTARCAADDLIGDLDAVVLMREFEDLDDDSGTPVTDLLRSYYDVEHPPADRSAVHANNRFHLFLARVVPDIDQEDDPAGGPGARKLGADAATDVREALREAVHTLLYTARYRRASFHTDALDAFPEGRPTVVRELPLVGRVGFNEINREIDHELGSPWGAAMLQAVTDRFTAWLRAGLTGDGWTLNGWPLVNPLERWGGSMLSIGSKDPASAPGPDGTPPPLGPVRRLQTDLMALGFTVITAADGDFGGRTAVALREFQIEAQQSQFHRDVPAGPAPRPDELAWMRYRGPVNGVLDHDTAQVLATWVEASGLTDPTATPVRLNPLRVRSHRYSSAGLGVVVHDDVWTWNQVTDSSLVLCAVDGLRRQWFEAAERGATPAPELGAQGNDPVVLGSWTPEGTGGPVQMPNKAIRRTWAGAEMTPYTCGDPDVPPSPALPVVVSQYRVVRAIAKVEMYGYFDVHNCWDIARLSMGMYHWTLGPNGRWELPAMLSHYRTHYPQDYERDFGSWGVGIAEGWDDTQPPDSVNRAKLTGTLAMYGLHDEDGVLQPYLALPFTPADGGGVKDAYLLDWYRSWRVLHRLLSVARTSRRFQYAQYRFALIRLRTLLGRAFQTASGPEDTGPFRADGSVATFGDVFTSEQAVAALLRWHVNRPNQIIGANGAVNAARSAYEAVHGTGRVAIDGLPTAGADARQQALARWLIDNATTDGAFQNSVRLAVEYNDAHYGRLSDQAGSLVQP
ncbi:peptidoglycan-binding protein [Kitasatospora sp. NBC_01539]|uniref:peptidoglycan-binding protein n=1 Tax=Kitasatospora sp. NBC_01539 TaxID=2903577 RepID=UPI0038602444